MDRGGGDKQDQKRIRRSWAHAVAAVGEEATGQRTCRAMVFLPSALERPRRLAFGGETELLRLKGIDKLATNEPGHVLDWGVFTLTKQPIAVGRSGQAGDSVTEITFEMIQAGKQTLLSLIAEDDIKMSDPALVVEEVWKAMQLAREISTREA
jgi:hypothetical protein